MEDCEETISEDGKTTVYTRDGQFVAEYVKTDDAEYWYNADGEQHRDDGPAIIYYRNGQKTREIWCRDDQLHRDDGPATICYENGQKTDEIWHRNDKLHRDDGPAVICYRNGQKTREIWCRDGKLSGNVLAYVWLADINRYTEIYIPCTKINTLDDFRNAVKSPLALELMRPLPIPIRDVIIWHYCYQ